MIVEASITINASKAAVWAATTDIARFAELLSGVEKIETAEKWITEAKELSYDTR